MQEIAQGVYIENAYMGVTLGLITQLQGFLLIDAPPRPEDVRSWRMSMASLGGGPERLLVNLDAHADRTLGVRAMECTVVAHEKTAMVFRNRPTAFKAQDVATGAEWEQCNGLGTIRWAPPEITFSHSLHLHADDQSDAILEYHPGPNPGGVWVVLPQAHVAFVGDAVVYPQPPFLANANLDEWISSLELLLSPEFQDYLIVGGRSGLVSQDQVRSQLAFLRVVASRLDELARQQADPEDTAALVPELMVSLEVPDLRQEQFSQRLQWGLYYYYIRHYRAVTEDPVEG